MTYTYPVRHRHHNTAEHREELARAINMADFGFEVARGNVEGVSKVNKFGRSVNVDSGVDTDIHDGANASSWPTAALDDRDTWIAPTQARTHQIASTSTDDDGDPAGTGARTIQVYGLTDWDTKETSEPVTLNGTTPVNTVNSYVIIHRMKVLTKGTSGPNVGTITATADTDNTITAQINPAEGQTQMAVYGIPSVQTAYMYRYYASAIKAAASLSVAITCLVNPEPDSEETTFLVKHTSGITTEGTNAMECNFPIPFTISGPAIIKISGNASANNTDVSAGFDLFLEDN